MNSLFLSRRGPLPIQTIICFALAISCLLTSTPTLADNRPFKAVRLTGVFNNWNTVDDNYAMKKVGPRYELTRFWQCGTHPFKFTFDGSWDRHWGDAGTGHLRQPGKNIDLRLPQSGEYTVWLDVKNECWGVELRTSSKPHAVIRAFGQGTGIAIFDAFASLAPPGKALTKHAWNIEKDGQKILSKEFEITSGDALPQLRFPVSTSGRYSISLTVSDGEMDDTATLAVELDTGWELMIAPNKATDETSWQSMRPLLQGRWGIPLPMGKNETRDIEIRNKDTSSRQPHTSTIALHPTKTLAVFDPRSGEISVCDEAWHEFVYEPLKDVTLPKNLKIKSVELVGSFNGWRPNDIAMFSKNGDGTFQRILELPDGVHHYKFLVNGVYWQEDPNGDSRFRRADERGGFQSGVLIGADSRIYGLAKPNAINAEALKHDPGKTRYLTPIASDLAYLTVRTLASDVEAVDLVLMNEPSKPIAMRLSKSRYGFDYWHAQTLLKKLPPKYVFRLRDGQTEMFLNGLGPQATIGRPDDAFSPQLEPTFQTPDWAKKAIWYQIFPERFRNGTSDNDPPKTVPWTHEWFKPYRVTDSTDPAKNFVEEGTFYEYFVFDRRYGGDLQGIREKLPYLRDLGITAIYFNPVFIAESLHKYDATDFRHIDDFFAVKGSLDKIERETHDPATWQWSDSDLLFLDFIKEAHRLGFKVVIDGVFNHTGRDFWAFQDILKNGKNSPYAGWFEIDNWEPFQYQAWDRPNGALPKLKHDEALGLAIPVRDHFFAVTKRWMDPNGDGDPSDGIDGWRLDVASDVNANFWRPWRDIVKSTNPDAYIVAELWEESRGWLKGDTFDAVMHYPFARSCQKFFVNRKKRIEPSQFQHELFDALTWYQPQVNYVLQMLFDSHDTDRIASMFMNPDVQYDGNNRIQDNGPDYDTTKPTPECYHRLKPMVTMQMTWQGAPMVYYGDEVGMYGADDPNCRKPMLWDDLLPYDDALERIERDVFRHYHRMIAIRNTFPALQLGMSEPLLADNKQDVFAFARTLGTETIVIVINNGGKPYELNVAVPWSDKAEVIQLDNPEACEIVPTPKGNLTARPTVRPRPGHESPLKITNGKLQGTVLGPWSAGVFGKSVGVSGKIDD